MGIYLSTPPPLYCDNKSTLQIAQNDVLYEHTKHIKTDCNFVHPQLREHTILLHVISLPHLPSDLLTKPHPTPCFQQLLSKLSMPPATLYELEGGCDCEDT
eukprot:TRINITY_DN5605_c2_g1_i4.p1 TRINITY_DN5605_c2_g1~~TRINITY_DN5605_c2_g1_i4.p1  ORF type:complete len:101 (+),score=10.95 TRINITY_DN5605_c2_g1_i4:1386-1688(+)